MREHLRALIAISIHALLTESDRFPVIGTDPSAIFQSTLSSRRATISGTSRPTSLAYFNPRSPHGERLQGALELVQPIVISIHALLTESDSSGFLSFPVVLLFQSTLSSRRATLRAAGRPGRLRYFNPRSPHGERPAEMPGLANWILLFQSTLSSRRATWRRWRQRCAAS